MLPLGPGVMIAVNEREDFINIIEADVEVILRFTDVVQQVRLEVGIAEAPKSEWSGAQPVDPALLEKYEAFLNRHGSIGGVKR